MHDCPRNSIQAWPRYVDKNRWGEGEEKRETWIDTWIDGIYIRKSCIDTATLVYMCMCVCCSLRNAVLHFELMEMVDGNEIEMWRGWSIPDVSGLRNTIVRPVIPDNRSNFIRHRHKCINS